MVKLTNLMAYYRSDLSVKFKYGKYFGEDIILQAGRRTYTVRALTFTDLFVLRKEDLFSILGAS